MLTSEEEYRYNRHLILPELGRKGQEKLKNARILVIGAGGLGCPVLQYLTAAGVGTIGINDFDQVDLSNLQRQILFGTEDVGKNKAFAASERLRQLNPFTSFEIHQDRLDNSNALALFEQYDLVIDGTDNFATRYLVNDACVITNKPLIYGSIFKFEGQVSVFNYQNGPTYRCLFPEPPEPGTVPSCSEIGVIGVLPGIIGTQQANEALKIVLEIGSPLNGKLLTYNALSSQYYTLSITRNEAEINRVLAEKDHFPNFDYDFFCGMKSSGEITCGELRKILSSNERIQIIDVRESHEMPKIDALNATNIPLGQISSPDLINGLDRSMKTVIFCQHGVRSLKAIDTLEDLGFSNLLNLTGGIVRW